MRPSPGGRDGNIAGSGAESVRLCIGLAALRDEIEVSSRFGNSASCLRLDRKSRMKRERHVRFCEGGGVKSPSATRLVVLCRTASAARVAHKRVQDILTRLGLELHPEKTRAVDLRGGREGFDFLGCTVRKRRSIQRRPDKHYMQRWPSARAIKRVRERVHELTTVRGNPAGEVMDLITALNPVLRGWGKYFA